MRRLQFLSIVIVALASGGGLSGSSSYPFASARAQDTAEAGGLLSPDGPVATINRSTFISSVLETHRPVLVWLYPGEDCVQCEQAAAMIEGAAPKLQSWGMSVFAVDMSSETKLAKELGAPKSAPMIFKVYHSESSPNPYGGLPVRREEFIPDFKDARSLQKKVLSAIPNLVKTADIRKDTSSLREALAESGEAKHVAVLLTNSGKASPVLRVLASVVGGKVAAVQARTPELESDGDEEESLASVLDGVFKVKGEKVPPVPALVLVNKEVGEGVAYEGDVENAEAMLAFIGDTAGVPMATGSTSGDAGLGDDSNKGSRVSRGGVLELDPESLARLEEEGIEALVVAFVKGGDASAVPGWSEATKALAGQIRAGVVDCDKHPGQCDGSGGRKAPHVRVYPHKRGFDGDNRALPSVFPTSEIKEAVSEAEASLPEIVTIIPSGTNFQRTQEALQGFVGTTIIAEKGPMSLFVLSKREEPNLVVKTIAAQFQEEKIRTVFISQPDQETMSSLGVSKLPAMLLVFPPPEGVSAPDNGKPSAEGQQMMTAHYSPAQFGPISHDSVSNFILSNLSSVNLEAFFSHVREMSKTASLNGEKLEPNLERILETAQSESPSPGGDDETLSPFVGVPEATAEIWASVTGEDTAHPRTVVGVFLLDRYADGFDLALKAAEAAAERASSRLGSGGGAFAWLDAPCQQGFASALGVSDPSEVPVLVAYSPKHQRSARFVGAWDEESLGLFLGKSLGGREAMFPIGGNEGPRLEEGVDCSQREPPSWLADGDQAGEGGIEDEDMGDLMAEILAEEARAKQQLEEEVAKGLEELKKAEGGGDKGEASPKKKTKMVKKKKKKDKKKNKKASSGSSATRSEL